jgi:rare lipoprotein A (peptidoglycan hydrolase)
LPTTTTTTAPAPPVEEVSARAAAAPTVGPATEGAVASAPTTDGERGQATWYAEAPAGMCASPTLPFGTVLTVTNAVTGASTTCTVDDREQAGFPRVVDMSPSGFAQLADPSQGVVDVTISW